MPTMSHDYQIVQMLLFIDSNPKLKHLLKITAHYLHHTQHPQTNSMSLHLILNHYAYVCSISLF